METILYNPEHKELWDDFVKNARNATFLFERDFMDYHKDRFTDGSLLFFNTKGKLTGVLPANIRTADKRIDSHGGLTYGGLLLAKDTSLISVKEMLKTAAGKYIDMGMETLRYKPLPYIYHKYPTQEDLYWLFRAEANLATRATSTTIDLTSALPFSTLRKRKVKKAQAAGLQVVHGGQQNWRDYWDILNVVLQEQHHTRPVHNLSEIRRLASHFPERIQLFTVHGFEQCLAGCVTFDCGEVMHIQYIASNDIGKEHGALDYLFQYLISEAQQKGKHYFDFGISTEDGGHLLNEGLLFQKEGFGGRSVCYDLYEVQLEKLMQL